MAQCKVKGCKTQAVPVGKRYCPDHYAAYRERQRQYAEVEANLPFCTECEHNKVSPFRAESGITICVHCEKIMFEENEHDRMVDEFNAIDTIRDLKIWMEEFHPELLSRK